MADDRRKDTLAPESSAGGSTRATGLFARTVYRELRRADYTRPEVLAFVNELLELMIRSDAGGPRASSVPVDSLIDAETGLLNRAVLLETLEFEMRRAREAVPPRPLLVVVFGLITPEHCPDEVVFQSHLRVASVLHQMVRPRDTVGRMDASRYVLICPEALVANAPTVIRRIGAALYASRRGADRDSGALQGTTVLARAVELEVGDGGAADLLARCSAADPITLAPTPAPSRSTAPTDDGLVLVLGGGGARAAAHIGALRALRESGVRVAGVVATSAGALVGAMHLVGLDDAEILRRFECFPHSEIYREMRHLFATYLRSAKLGEGSNRYLLQSGVNFTSTTRLAAVPDDLYAAFVEHFVGPDRAMGTLTRPFAAVATELVEGRASIFVHGQLHAALRASCAIPGLFAPQEVDGRLFIDGSALAEVPVGVAAQLGWSRATLAIHLARAPRRAPTFTTSAEVMARASALMQSELVREQLGRAQDVITLDAGVAGWLDFRRAPALADAGEAATRAYLARTMRSQ